MPGVRLLTLNRPEKLNTLNRDFVEEFKAALAVVRVDRNCRVVVLTGAGRAFCAGIDLGGYGDEDQIGEPSPINYLVRQESIADLFVQLHELEVPVIAAINGAAAGAGLAFACASDIRIAAKSSIFAASFIRAGYSGCDVGVSWLLPRIVGAGRAHELMLTGRRCGTEEALRIGLVTAIVEPDQLLSAAYSKAAEIMLNPPFSVQLTKEGMWHAVESTDMRSTVAFENRQQVLTALTQDCDEAQRAFLSKRAPVYTFR
ncbi:enoyl-CoA hydratase [Williamsia sp. 1138]|nr:enoyl-CoA hydratase [Williamsia sp. 1138]